MFRLLLISVTCVALVSSASRGYQQRRKYNRDGPLDWPEFFDFESFENTRYRPNSEADEANYRQPENHPNHRPEYEPVEPYRSNVEEKPKEPRQEDPFTKQIPGWLQQLNDLNQRQPAFPEQQYSPEPQYNPEPQYTPEPLQPTENPVKTSSRIPQSIQDKLPKFQKKKNQPTTQRPIVVEVAHSIPPKINTQSQHVTSQPQPNFQQQPVPTYQQQPISNLQQQPIINYQQQQFKDFQQQPVNYQQQPVNYQQQPVNYQQPQIKDFQQQPITNYQQQPINIPVIPVSTPLALHSPGAGNRAPTLLLPLPSPVQVDPVIPAIQDSPKGKKKQLDLPPLYNPINPADPVAPLSTPLNGAPIIQVKTAHRLEPKRTVKNGFKMLMGKTPDYETLEEHMKRRHESISAKIADGLYSYARADWIKQRMPTFKKSAEGA